MSKTVKLKRGEAVLSEVVTYGLKKRMTAVMFSGRDVDLVKKTANVSFAALEEAQNIGILGLLEKLTINGEEWAIEQASLEKLLQEEYEAIGAVATLILNPEDHQKKRTN